MAKIMEIVETVETVEIVETVETGVMAVETMAMVAGTGETIKQKFDPISTPHERQGQHEAGLVVSQLWGG